MTISMTPLPRGAGKPGQEPTAAASAVTDGPRFAELLSRQAGADAAGQPASITLLEVSAGSRDDTPSASGEAGDPALSPKPAVQPTSAHTDSQPADTEPEPATPGTVAGPEPAEIAGYPVVATALPAIQPGTVEPAEVIPGKSLPVAAALDEPGARPDAAGKVSGKELSDTSPAASIGVGKTAETATETGDIRSGRPPEGQALAVAGRDPIVVAGRAQASSPETRPGLREGEGSAPLPPVDRADVDIPVREPSVTRADGEGWAEEAESRGKNAGIRINESDLLVMDADAEGRKDNTDTRGKGADIRIDAPAFRVIDERESTLEGRGKGDERRVKEAELRVTRAEMAPKVPGGEASLQFGAESDEPVSSTPSSLSIVSDDDLPAPGTKATEAALSSVQSGEAKPQMHGLGGVSEPGTGLPTEPRPVSAPAAGEGDGHRDDAPDRPVGETPIDTPVLWYREGRAQGQERDAPPATAGMVPATPEWLAQIEHGQRWQQGTEGAGGKPVPPTVEPKGASGDMPAVAPAEPDTGTGQPLVEVPLSGSNPVPGQGSGPVVPEPVSAVVAPNRDGVQGSVPQPERPVTLERTLTLQGGTEHSARQLSQQVQVMVSQDLQEADIRLSPSELGGIRIQLKMEQGEVNIQFLASQPQARELLEQALPRLRDMLVQQGMTLGQGQVGGFTGQQGAPQQGAAQQQGAPGHGQQHARQDGDAENLEWTDGEPAGPRRPATGTIDFFA